MRLSSKLLIWFIVVSLTIGSISLIISASYFNAKEKANQQLEGFNYIFFTFLKLKITSNDFFANESINSFYYEKGTSSYLGNYDILFKDLSTKLEGDSLLENQNQEIFTNISKIHELLEERNSVFQLLVELMTKRGHKDYGIIGEMREYAHQLEENSKFNKSNILNLRRREKDYLIRHEQQYIDSFIGIAKKVELQIRSLTPNKQLQQNLLDNLNNYSANLNAVVDFDKKTGLHNNSGLKSQLNSIDLDIEHYLMKTVEYAQTNNKQIIKTLNRTTALSLFVIFIVCILLAKFLSKQITKPLSRLTIAIESLVSKNILNQNILKPRGNTKEIQILYSEFNDMLTRLQENQKEKDALIKQLTQSERKFRNMADRLPQGLFETDSKGCIIYVNKIWEDNFNITKQEAEFSINIFDTIKRNKKNRNKNEVIAIRKDKTWFPALLYLDRIYENKTPKGWRGIIIDISERYQYLKLLKEEQQKALESDRLKSVFLANISHEIRTPLNAIVGFGNILRTTQTTESERNEFLSIIETNSLDLLKVFENIVEVSRLESKLFTQNPQAVNLNTFKTEVLDIVEK